MASGKKAALDLGVLVEILDQDLSIPELRSQLRIFVHPQKRKLTVESFLEDQLRVFHVGIEGRHGLGAQLRSGLGHGVGGQKQKSKNSEKQTAHSTSTSANNHRPPIVTHSRLAALESARH